MSVGDFLSELRRLDIRVRMDGDKLRCNAPAGTVTDELREQLRLRRNDILDFLRMADAVTSQQSAIIPLQPGGRGAPVFGLGGHTGDVFCYRGLAHALAEERPFFGLQPPGLDGRSEPLERVEALADYFAQEIRTFRPQGPLIIAGFCSGGTIAFELARRLLAAGRPAEVLALFGVPYPTFYRPASLFRHRLVYRAREFRRRVRVLAAQSHGERLEYLAWRLQPRRPAADPVLQMRARVEQATLVALRAYQPKPFAGRAHHFVPCAAWARQAGTGGWRSVAALDETFGPRGCTADDMLQAPFVRVFAGQFRAACARLGV